MTFISNVIVQVIERHIIHGLENIFDVAKLVEMDDKSVRTIAEEDQELKNRRSSLEQKLDSINEAYKVCLGAIERNWRKVRIRNFGYGMFHQQIILQLITPLTLNDT